MKKRREAARKYFKGGTMPDGLKLFPMTMGKREWMGDAYSDARPQLGEMSDPEQEKSLTDMAIYTYAHKLSALEQEEDPLGAAIAFCKGLTAEDYTAAQEPIGRDFEAMGLLAVEPAEEPGKTEEAEPNHSAPPHSEPQLTR